MGYPSGGANITINLIPVPGGMAAGDLLVAVGDGTVVGGGAFNVTGDATIATGKNLVLASAGAGTKIGTNANQKLGFWNATPGTQPAFIASPTAGNVIDGEARDAIDAIRTLLSTIGLMAAS